MPEALWWGLWPVTYLPAWAFWGGAALVLLSIAVFWWRELYPAPGAVPQTQPEHEFDIPWWALVLVSAVLIGLFFRYPVAHTRWGDAFVLAKGIAFSDPCCG